MEYTLVAKVSYRDHGDYEDTVKQVELGNREIDSKEAIERVAEAIASQLKIQDTLHYNGYSDEDVFPKHNEFYLETTPVGEWGSSKMYKIELVDCIKIKGRLFVLKAFSLYE